MDEIGVEAKVVNLAEVSKYIKTLPDETFTLFKTELAKALFEADENIKTKSELGRRSGNLMKSITTRILGDSFSNLDAGVSTDSVYAPIQEEGGTVKAKNAYKNMPGGPFLNIPGKANLTAAGVQRLTARMVFAQGGFIMGRTVMRGGDNEARKYDVMFFLVKSTTIEARLNMVSSTEEVVPTFLSRVRNKIGE